RQVRHAARMRRRLSSRKTRHRQIEAAPEKMYRTHLAEKAGAEMRKYIVRREQDAPEAVRIITVVRGVCEVPIERKASCDLGRHRGDACHDSEFGECGEQFTVELCNRFRCEHELTDMAVVRSHPQNMVHEVEIDLEGAAAVRYRGSRQTARGYIQSHMP